MTPTGQEPAPSEAMSNDDTRFMREALLLAERGRYSTTPNPTVGCIVVNNGEIVGRGHHVRAGQAHAEIAALADAGGAARNATIYVTLEPCNHQGRTGPCTEALIQAGISRVVYAVDDPNPSVAGGGSERLRSAGITVVSGVAAAAAAQLNRGFLQRMRNGRPRIRIKLAMSLDGGVALADGQSQWITGPIARADVQRLRAESCAIVTGVGTLLADDPLLTVRDARFALGDRQPQRCVMDSRLRTPACARMLAAPGVTRIFTISHDIASRARLEAAGAVVETCPAHGAVLDLAGVVQRLGELELNEVLVEAGPTLAGQFIEQACFDELIVHVAPKLLGRAARRAFELPSPSYLHEARQLNLLTSMRLGDDIALTFVPK